MNKVTKTKNNGQALAAVSIDSIMSDAESLSGLENVNSADDLALPFLKVLSQLSPQCNKTSNNFVEGAEPGMIYNSVSGKLYDGEEGIDIVPCFYKREFIEWGERGQGSGAPIAIHDSNYDISQAPRDAGFQNRLPNGNIVEETANHFVLILNVDGFEQALITMKSTQRKVSRKWNSMMLQVKMQGPDGKSFTPPSYSHVYRIKTIPQSNSKGTWFGWEVFKISPVQESTVYDAAKLFAQGVSKNAVKVEHADEAQVSKKSAF